jgi:glycine/D-amino acid oxidase-like deaminating enzyme
MRVAVLGAGLQGACVAMELASAGIAVDLYDKNDRCLTQASVQNEGKIHLGYVYAHDRTLRTARTMIRGAIAFAPLLRRWIGDAVDAIPVSTAFYYLVHADSLLGADEVERHLQRAHAIAHEESAGAQPDYFGGDYRAAPSRLPETEVESLFDRRSVSATFKTPEIAIDPEALAEAVRTRLAADPRIRCLLRTRVRRVTASTDGPIVDFDVRGAPESERYDHVVNALWDGRLAIDRSFGLELTPPWLYRVKHYVRLSAPARRGTVPSSTIVLGPFGDIGAYDGGDFYLSWYPVGMRGASSDVSPPDWPLELDEPASIAVRRGIVDGLARVVPAVGDLIADTLERGELKAGIIFAWGRPISMTGRAGSTNAMRSVRDRMAAIIRSIPES